MSTLLDLVIDAHHGWDRWPRLSGASARATIGGGIWALKGQRGASDVRIVDCVTAVVVRCVLLTDPVRSGLQLGAYADRSHLPSVNDSAEEVCVGAGSGRGSARTRGVDSGRDRVEAPPSHPRTRNLADTC